MTSPETRLVLIRHGESVAQVEGFVSGHDTCRGLSDAGRAQAAALRDRLLTTRELDGVSAVYTSILGRAVETTEILAPALGGVSAHQECEWCEIHAGEAEGQTWAALREQYPLLESRDPFVRRFPGSETWAEFAVRAGARLRRIAEDHPGERVVVVCHGGIIGASFIALANVSFRDVGPLIYESTNTSLTEWRHNGKEWHLVRFNDAAHLAALS
jgi:broad specificity phosphatase PhoE